MGYRFLRFPEGKEKAVTFSFDDGNKQDVQLAKLMTKYHLKCTFNFNNMLCEEDRISVEDAKTYIIDKGHEIAVHGYNHKAEGCIRPIEGIRDILECRLELEQKFDRIIRGMAYPDFGIESIVEDVTYEQIKNCLKELDIVYARTLRSEKGDFRLPKDWHNWVPTTHYSNPEIMHYIDDFCGDKVKGWVHPATKYPKLFFIWGHSYEFDSDNNWDVMEDICKKFSTRQDIWFATNLEIYEYVTAYHSLVYSADGQMIYNPSLLDIWFDIGGKGFCIQSGETLKL